MSTLVINVPIGLGDLIYLKAMLDTVKHRYQKIKIKFHRDIIKFYAFDPGYHKFLDEIGALFFSEAPYELTSEDGIPFYGMVSICNDNKIPPVKPNLVHLLCKGTPLNIGQEYLVLNTKIRYLARDQLDLRVMEFWSMMQRLAQRYKIVIVGERVVEFNHGYLEMGPNAVYSIYDSIKEHIPSDRIVDCTIPALGKTSPSLSQIQQDCLIMSGAKAVITLGVGGGFCMATAVANVIGFRLDSDPIADVVFNRHYPNAIVTKDWAYFLEMLRTRL